MALTPTYTLTALQVPAVAVPAAPTWINLSDAGGNMLTSEPILSGDNTNFVAYLNHYGKRIELLGRYGGGGYAVLQGLDLVSSGVGLTLTINLGQAIGDGILEVADNQVETMVTGRNYLWLKPSIGTVGLITSTTNTTPPAAGSVFLGSVVSDGTNITQVDYSGRMMVWQRGLVRQTAEIGMPQDAPPAGVQFLNLTQDGAYFWDGTLYRQWGALQPAAVDTVPSGSWVVIPIGSQAQLFDSLTVYGSSVVYGKRRVI